MEPSLFTRKNVWVGTGVTAWLREQLRAFRGPIQEHSEKRKTITKSLKRGLFMRYSCAQEVRSKLPMLLYATAQRGLVDSLEPQRMMSHVMIMVTYYCRFDCFHQ